jgi:membrane-bound lytic murein transglycosylase A
MHRFLRLHRLRSAAATLIVVTPALLAACASDAEVPAEPASPTLPAAETAAFAGPAFMQRERSRWIAAAWSDLPGWNDDRVREFWPALQRSCERPSANWQRLCERVAALTPRDDGEAREWLAGNLQPYRVEAPDGRTEGLATGYFEPLLDASRRPRDAFRVPVYAPPADLLQRRPYWTRRQIDTLPDAQAALRGREIAYVANPLDALLLQVQGSGRLRLADVDGRARVIRVSYAGHNDHPYQSVGRWLIERGELRAGEASWPAIRAWAQRNPARVYELLWANARYVFFREEPLADPQSGPRGAQGVALTPGRSIAVDPLSIPYGTPVWLDTTEPLTSRPLRRLVLAQDTGSAIVGAVRADFFWGWGSEAEEQAGRMKQPLRMWALWPKASSVR